MKGLEDCISGILLEIQRRKKVNYSDKSSVKKFNAAYNRCYNYLQYIDQHYPDQIQVLMRLLEHPDWEVVGHCAPMILTLQNSTKEEKRQALDAIRNLLNDSRVDQVTKHGLAISLKKWETEYN